jgi:predicted RNA-binding protein
MYKKIGQVSAKPKGSGDFTRSPNLLIWLLEQKYKTKCKRFGLWIIRMGIAYLQPYFFYTKRFSSNNFQRPFPPN